MKMKYKAVLLDIDNTLYSYAESHEAGLKSALSLITRSKGLPTEVLKKAYLQARCSIHQELEGTGASHNRLLYFQRLCEFLDIHDLAWPLRLYEEYWNVFFDGMKLRDGVLDFFHSIEGCKIVFVTDLTAHIQFRKVKKLGLDKFVRHIVTSEEAGREKPHPWVFALALKKAGCCPHDVCMVGDSLEKDMKGAVASGIKGYWLTSDKEKTIDNPGITPFRTFLELKEYMNDQS